MLWQEGRTYWDKRFPGQEYAFNSRWVSGSEKESISWEHSRKPSSMLEVRCWLSKLLWIWGGRMGIEKNNMPQSLLVLQDLAIFLNKFFPGCCKPLVNFSSLEKLTIFASVFVGLMEMIFKCFYFVIFADVLLLNFEFFL